MSLRTIMLVDAIIFVVSACVYGALYFDNAESQDPSPIFKLAFWVAGASFVLFVVGAVTAAQRTARKGS